MKFGPKTTAVICMPPATTKPIPTTRFGINRATLRNIGAAILDLIRGVPTPKMLADMTDRELMAQVKFDVAGGRFDTPYADELARRQMTDAQLLDYINYDAEDGRIDTPYSREYDRRRAGRNAVTC